MPTNTREAPDIGSRVTIYSDPVGRTIPEGSATIVQYIRRLPGIYAGGGAFLCKVRFAGEHKNVQRVILDYRAGEPPTPPHRVPREQMKLPEVPA